MLEFIWIRITCPNDATYLPVAQSFVNRIVLFSFNGHCMVLSVFFDLPILYLQTFRIKNWCMSVFGSFCYHVLNVLPHLCNNKIKLVWKSSGRNKITCKRSPRPCPCPSRYSDYRKIVPRTFILYLVILLPVPTKLFYWDHFVIWSSDFNLYEYVIHNSQYSINRYDFTIQYK